MNLNGNFLKNKILSFSKKGKENLEEDDFDFEDKLDDDEFFEDFFEQNKKSENKEEETIPQPVKKSQPVQNYEAQLNASAEQIKKPTTPAKENNNYDSYKYDFGKTQNFNSEPAQIKPQKIETQFQMPKPVKKQAPIQSNYNPSALFADVEEAKVYAIVLKSADDVRSVVDCMMEKQIIAIYIDMTKLSKLDERRALDFIDG
ncbi:MAG: hypothetical protein R3Y27_04395, partial [Clostridia bacterium]